MDDTTIIEEYRNDDNSNWVKQREFNNFLKGIVPLVPCFNPSGISDILQIIPIQDDINKLHFDLRVIREYQGFPLLVTDRDVPANLRVAPGQILDNAGDLRRIDTPSIAPMLEEHTSLVETMSILGTSLALSDRNGSNISGVALRYLQQQFESKLQGKAQQLANTYKNILRIAAKYVTSYQELYEAEVVNNMDIPVPLSVLAGDFDFSVELEPSIPADEVAQGNRAISLFQAGLADRETAMSIAGVPSPDIVSNRINEEIQSTDLALRVEKVRLGLELGVNRDILARELGFEDGDLFNEPQDSTDNQEIRTAFGEVTETESQDDNESIETVISTTARQDEDS